MFCNVFSELSDQFSLVVTQRGLGSKGTKLYAKGFLRFEVPFDLKITPFARKKTMLRRIQPLNKRSFKKEPVWHCFLQQRFSYRVNYVANQA